MDITELDTEFITGTISQLRLLDHHLTTGFDFSFKLTELIETIVFEGCPGATMFVLDLDFHIPLIVELVAELGDNAFEIETATTFRTGILYVLVILIAGVSHAAV